MTARIYGNVKDAATGLKIATASVVAPPYTVVCSSGSYYFITPGAVNNVVITASDPNYISQNKTASVANGGTKQVDFLLVHV